jgi:hypothetical protein
MRILALSACISIFRAASACSEKGVRLAQKKQVGPWVLGWPKRSKLAHAFQWEYSHKRLKASFSLVPAAPRAPAGSGWLGWSTARLPGRAQAAAAWAASQAAHGRRLAGG